MNVVKSGRLFPFSLMLLTVMTLAACGFHLRGDAALPASMQHVHLVMHGGDFQRKLARALQHSGATVEEASGSGIAELHVPVASFSTDRVTAGGYTKDIEYAIRYQVNFYVTDAGGDVSVPRQTVNMSREYAYNASNTVGEDSQMQQIRRSLNDDMVQAILFRLQAAGKHQLAAPAPASSTH